MSTSRTSHSHRGRRRRRWRASALVAGPLALAAFVAASGSANASPPVEQAAAPTAIARSTNTLGLRYTGTDAVNNVVITQTGTPTNSSFLIDDIVPIQASTGCLPVSGDATKVACILFRNANGQALPFHVSVRGGDDVVTNNTGFGTGRGIDMIAHGEAGHDVLNGITDRLSVETLHGGVGNDTLNGGPGDDKLRGDNGDDTLNGDGNDDTLVGGNDADRLFGGDGRFDSLDGSSGPDLLDGGPGVQDDVRYSNRDAALHLDLSEAGAVQGELGEGDTIVNIEDAFGGQGDDFISGDDADNTFIGSGGDDFLVGHGGADALLGDDGNDVLFGNDGLPDGARDILVGLDDFDACDRSIADDDFVDPTCESILDI